VVAKARRRWFGRNDYVFHDGDRDDTLQLVVAGHFAVRIGTHQGDTATVRVVGSGDHFGELAVLSPGSRTGAVMAMDQAETLSWRAEVIDEHRRQSPQIERMFTEALVAEVRRLAAALVEALYVSADQRVWRRLRDLAAL
jgi:CRP-like cAMP-binding protein